MFCVVAHNRIRCAMFDKVPDKPTWYGRLDDVIAELSNLPFPWIDRQTLQSLLHVGPRRAQQILRPCGARRIGSNIVADREELIAHLKRLASGDVAYYERQRRQRLAKALAQPTVWVAAPATVLSQEFANLPEGVEVMPGRISVTFSSPQEALERLLALAMAIGNDFSEFERVVGA